MAIRAQCDNCGKVYNVPESSAGKRLRCKQCAVVFAVPGGVAAEAPTMARAPQKVCVVCGQDVAGKPRTKDPSGNYYCRSCYEEKARAREQLAQSRVGAAVPAGVGGGSGSDQGDLVDLSALEPQEQFDGSTQPPPPPIPNIDLVAPPIPDMEPVMALPVMVEVPRPVKKKKKKKVAPAADKTDSFNSIISKIIALPLEIWVMAIGAMIIGAALVNHQTAPQAVLGLIALGVLTYFWGHICCLMAAFAEDGAMGARCIIIPLYQLVFILSNWDVTKRYVGRMVLGGIFFIAAMGISAKFDKDISDDSGIDLAKYAPKNLSSDPGIEIFVSLDETPEESEAALAAREKEIADAIMASFKQRGVRPPPGMKYKVEATAELGDEENQLACDLEVRDSNDTAIFQQQKVFTLPGEAAKTSRKKKSESALEKDLWKNAVPVFKELAGQVPATGGLPPAPAK